MGFDPSPSLNHTVPDTSWNSSPGSKAEPFSNKCQVKETFPKQPLCLRILYKRSDVVSTFSQAGNSCKKKTIPTHVIITHIFQNSVLHSGPPVTLEGLQHGKVAEAFYWCLLSGTGIQRFTKCESSLSNQRKSAASDRPILQLSMPDSHLQPIFPISTQHHFYFLFFMVLSCTDPPQLSCNICKTCFTMIFFGKITSKLAWLSCGW